MPAIAALMDNLTKRYGEDKGKRVYYAMEASARGPFAVGNKHHIDHVRFAVENNVAPISGKRKAPAPGKRGPVKRKVTRRRPTTSVGRTSGSGR